MSVVVQPTERAVAEAAARLRAGGLVAFPTETVYGLGALARDPRAVGAIYRAKGRPASHPVIVHLPEAAALEGWATDVPAAAWTLAAQLWPGPLTLVLRRARGVPDVVTGGQDTVALRVPAHPVASALLAATGEGIAAPSANRFGRISPTRARHVADEFPDLDLTILDGGPCAVGLESTILDLSGDRPRLLRPGGTPLAAIEGILGAAVLEPPLPAGSDAGAAVPRAPGSLPSHYAPEAAARVAGVEALLQGAASLGPATAVLSRHAAPAGSRAGRWIRLPESAEGYARELYDALRRADGGGVRTILIEQVPDGPAWRAVRDRIARATVPRDAGVRRP